MPTFASNVLPVNSGLSLGNSNQKWLAYLSSVFADVIQTNTPNQALSGTFRLASLDTIAWRNAANTADVTLSKTNSASTTTPADTLVFNGSGIEGPFLSHNINPSSTGELRLAGTDGIYFRNNANSGDIAAIIHNSDDTITLGGAAGVTFANSTLPSLIVTGTLTPGAITGPAGADLPIAAGASRNLTLTAGADSTTGKDVTIAGGLGFSAPGAGGNVFIHGGAKTGLGVAGAVNIGDINGSVNLGRVGGTLNLLTTVNQYNSITTVGSGIPSQVAAVDLTAQTAAITATTLYTPTATGWFRVNAYLKITTAGTSPVLGPVTIAYTDGTDSVAQSVIMSCQTQAGVAQATGNSGNTTTSVLTGILSIWAKTGVAITYAIALTGTVGAGAYEAHLRLESM